MPGVPGRFRPQALSDLWPRGPLAAVRSGSLSAHGLQSQRKMRSEMAKPKAVCRLPLQSPKKPRSPCGGVQANWRVSGTWRGCGSARRSRHPNGNALGVPDQPPLSSWAAGRDTPGPPPGLVLSPKPRADSLFGLGFVLGPAAMAAISGDRLGWHVDSAFCGQAAPASSAPTAASIRITITVIFTAGFYIVESRLWRRLQILMVSSHGGPTAESYEP